MIGRNPGELNTLPTEDTLQARAEMRFCPACQRVMIRNTSTGKVVFQCPCGVAEPGRAEDARIAGAVLGAGETTEMYRKLIRTAPFDRTNQKVMRTCPKCGLDYMTQLRIGEAEVIAYGCKCESERSPGSTAQPFENPPERSPGSTAQSSEKKERKQAPDQPAET